MKNTIYTIATIILINLFSNVSAVANSNPLSFMVPCDMKKAKEYAKVERKPVLIYIHSTKCSSSRSFTRQIMSNKAIAGWADKNFVCMEANVITSAGKDIAKKYGILKVPAIVMVSFDQDLEYNVDVKLDSVSLFNQFRSFLSANSLKSQIELLRETNGLSYADASKAIAASYAKADYKKNPNTSAQMMAFERTLNISQLNELSNAYIVEFKKLSGNTLAKN